MLEINLQQAQIGGGAEADGGLDGLDLDLRFHLLGEWPGFRHQQIEALGRHVRGPMAASRDFIDRTLESRIGPEQTRVQGGLQEFQNRGGCFVVLGRTKAGGHVRELFGCLGGTRSKIADTVRIHSAMNGRNECIDQGVFFFGHRNVRSLVWSVLECTPHAPREECRHAERDDYTRARVASAAWKLEPPRARRQSCSTLAAQTISLGRRACPCRSSPWPA